MLDKNELQEAVNTLVLEGGNKAAAARKLDVPISTFKDRLNLAYTMSINPTVLPPDMEHRISIIKQEYEDTITSLKRKVRESNRLDYSAETWREFLWGLTDHEPEAPKWTERTDATPGSPGDPTLILSDFHWGEVVDPDQVSGINKYNTDIASKRLENTVSNTIDLCFNHMVNPKYNGLVLALGGDMFSGDIHHELSATNEKHVMQLLFSLFDHMVEAIDRLADAFGRVYIVTAYGNHARTTMKPMFKDAAFTNFDWVLYNMLDHHYKHVQNRNVKINVTNSFDTQYRLAGVNFLLTHGDRLGVAGGSGVIGMIGPIIRGILKLKSQYATLDRNIDYTLMGHWHTLMWLRDGIVNGSLKGYDEYAMGLRFEPEAAQQALFFTHPTRGITFRVPVYCEDTPKVESNGDWVSVWENVV